MAELPGLRANVVTPRFPDGCGTADVRGPLQVGRRPVRKRGAPLKSSSPGRSDAQANPIPSPAQHDMLSRSRSDIRLLDAVTERQMQMHDRHMIATLLALSAQQNWKVSRTSFY